VIPRVAEHTLLPPVDILILRGKHREILDLILKIIDDIAGFLGHPKNRLTESAGSIPVAW
jgi:hypothetical protein